MEIEVCYAERDQARRIFITLAVGATVADAIERSRIAEAITPDVTTLGLAIFGRRATRATTLVDGDRVELLRPLAVDPAEARRTRAQASARHRSQTSIISGKCRQQSEATRFDASKPAPTLPSTSATMPRDIEPPIVAPSQDLVTEVNRDNAADGVEL